MSLRDRFKAALAAATDGVPSPATRSPSGTTGFASADQIERDKPPKEAYERYRQQYRGFGLVRAAIDLRASETVRPGYLVEADNDDLKDDLEEWLSEAAIYAGEIGQPFLPLLWQIARDHDLDGEVILEHVYDNPAAGEDEDREILGLKLVDPATVQFLPYQGTSMLVRPDDDPQENPRLAEDHPTTKRGELAAYVQFPDGYSRWDDREPVYLSQNDVTRVPRNPGFDSRKPTQNGPMADDVGNIRGISLVEAISEEVHRLRARFQDQNAAIAGMAYPRLKVQFRDYEVGEGSNAEIVHWDDTSIRNYMEGFDRTDEEKGYSPGDEYKEPGGKFGSPPGVETDLIEGSVPDIGEANTESINLILSGLNVPKYAVGYGEDLNRRISEEQETRFELDIQATRRKIGRNLTEILTAKAEELAANTDSYSDSDVESVRLRIQAEDTESVIRDEDFDAEKFSTILTTLTEFFNSDAPNYVPPEWVEDELNVNFDEYGSPEQAIREEFNVEGFEWGDPADGEATPSDNSPDPETREPKQTASLAQYSEGDEVDTPDGVGVVVEIRTEPFTGPDGSEVDASSDSPAYIVGTEDGAAVFRASDLSATTIDVDDVENPEAALEEIAAAAGHGPSVAALKERYVAGELSEERFEELAMQAIDAATDGADESALAPGGSFDYPESWEDSSTPNRIILLKAWAGMGGTHSGCTREMRGEVTSPDRFCASMKDRALGGWTGWRGG